MDLSIIYIWKPAIPVNLMDELDEVLKNHPCKINIKSALMQYYINNYKSID